MTTGTGQLVGETGFRPLLLRLARPASIVGFGVLPGFVVLLLFVDAARDDVVAFDFRVYYDAADAVLRGDSPYQSLNDPRAAVARGYVYPPLTALVATPFTIVSPSIAGVLVMALLVAGVLAVPLMLGVRDWRCFGLVLLWPPVISAIQTGSVTVFLALGAALAWRFRDRPFASSASLGATLAVKTVLWPVTVWLAATRRVTASLLSLVVAGVLVVGSWAAIGFVGMSDYPDVVRRLQKTVELDSYTAYVVALDAGASPAVARVVWLALGAAVLVAVVVVARRGEDAGAFVLAVAAALALSPIVWLHYFALLIVVVAVARPTLALAWFVPLAMVVTPGSGQPTPFETSATLAVAVLTFALSLRALHTVRMTEPARVGPRLEHLTE